MTFRIYLSFSWTRCDFINSTSTFDSNHIVSFIKSSSLFSDFPHVRFRFIFPYIYHFLQIFVYNSNKLFKKLKGLTRTILIAKTHFLIQRFIRSTTFLCSRYAKKSSGIFTSKTLIFLYDFLSFWCIILLYMRILEMQVSKMNFVKVDFSKIIFLTFINKPPFFFTSELRWIISSTFPNVVAKLRVKTIIYL